MAKRTPLGRLDDMLDAINSIENFMMASTLESFISDRKSKLAVERCLEIVSEASRHIPPDLTARYPQISWTDVRAIGNRIRHEYDRIDDVIIWKTATISVSELKPVIQAMIANLEAGTQEPHP